MLAGAVAVRVTELPNGGRLAGFSQVASCGSCWVCPVCAAKIAAQRAQEVQEIFKAWHERGGRAVLLTLTVRHSAADPLASVWDAVTAGWAAVTSGRAWVADQRELGTAMPGRGGAVSVRIPAVRVVETRWSEVSGWHVHIHAVLLVSGRVKAADVAAMGVAAWGRWDRAVVRAGLGSGDLAAMDCRLMTADKAGDVSGVGAYFNKASYELTRGSFKDSGSSWSPFQVLGGLADAAAGVEVAGSVTVERLRAVWAEWEAGSRGRRQLAVSVGLRAFLGLVEDVKEDQEIVDDDSLAGDVVALIEGRVWRYAIGAGLTIRILECFEISIRSGTDFLAVLEAAASGEGAFAFARSFVG